MGDRPAIPYHALRGRFRLALTLAPDLPDAVRRVAFLLLEMTNQRAYEAGEGLVAWIGAPTTGKVLQLNERVAYRARAALTKAGIIDVTPNEQVGRGFTAALRFRVDWLVRTWEALRGLIEALNWRDGMGGSTGMGDSGATHPAAGKDDAAITLPVVKGDAAVTLRPAAVTLPGADMGGAAVTHTDVATLPGAVKGDTSATLPEGAAIAGGKGDSAVTHAAAVTLPDAGKGDGGVTHARGVPVDNRPRTGVGPAGRVTNGDGKGDRRGAGRVTPVTGKPVILNPGNPTRARPPTPAAATAPPAQRSMILPIPGGRSVDGAAAVIAEWRKGLDRKQDLRFGTLLQRAGQLLGDQGRGSLAVSCLDQGLRQRILAGAQIRDPELLEALRAALDQVQPVAAGPASADAATDGAQVAGDGDLVDRVAAIEHRFDRIEAMLMRALGGGTAVAI